MELNFNEEDIKFREEVSKFISEAYTSDMRETLALSKNGHADKELHIKWQKALYERGWIAPNWPKNTEVQVLPLLRNIFLNQKWLKKERLEQYHLV